MAAAERVLASCRFILGPEVGALEAELAALCGARHGIGVNSGTDALVLALKAVGVRPGDEVITSSFSFVASASAVLMVGARPVFVDVDPITYNLDPALVARAVTPRTRAIVAVHLYGQPAAMDAIADAARARGLAVIEDAAQAVGASYAGRPAGAWGDAACLSFYPTKNLGALGDGGAVVTDDPELAERARLLRQYGEARQYESVLAGGNSRLDTLQAAVLAVGLRHLDAWTARRRELAALYREELAGLELVLPEELPGRHHVFHLYVVRAPEREQLRERLAERGVETLVHYPRPVHLQPAYARLARAGLGTSERLCAEVVSLPLYPELSDGEAEHVAAAARAVLGGAAV